MSAKRPHVPESMRRQLRKEVNFACPICGSIPLQCHHILSRCVNNPSHMIMLCGRCHDNVTKGGITEEELYELKERLKSVKRTPVRGKLAVGTNVTIVKLGGTFFENFPIPLMVDDVPLIKIGVSSGNVLFSAFFFGPKDELIAKVEENEWIILEEVKDIDRIWNIKQEEKKLKILYKPRGHNIGLEISSFNELDVIEITGRLCFRGVTVRMTRKSMYVSYGKEKGAAVTFHCAALVRRESNNYMPLIRLPTSMSFPLQVKVGVHCNTEEKSIGIGMSV